MGHTIGFVGLGVMGYAMAGHLARTGHTLRVCNRTPDKAARWVAEHGGGAVALPADAAEGADFVFACVGNDADLRTITVGRAGAFATMRPGSIFVDHTTASATLARELSGVAAERRFGFLDAPVSGGQSGAQNGTLSVMVGGTAEALASAQPMISAYARTVKLIGPSGSGQLAKMVNQICIAGLLQSLAEALHFAQCAELDVGAVLEVITKGAAQSWQMENRSASMLAGEFEHGFAVDWMRKDLAIALDEARRNGAQLPVAALVDQFYGEVQRMGGPRWDTSSLFARLQASRPSTGGGG